MAIHAVHAPAFSGRDLFRRRSGSEVLAHCPVACSEPNVGYDLSLRIGGDVFNLVVEIHVPVNAASNAERRTPTADEQCHCGSSLTVLLVVRVFTEHANLVAVDFSGQWHFSHVNLAGRIELNRRRHWLRNVAGRRLPELARACHFRVNQGADTRADVAIHAPHARVRPALMPHVLRLHRHVTHLSAEPRGFHVVHGTVRGHGEEDEVHAGERDDDRDDLSLSRDSEVENGPISWLGVGCAATTALTNIRRP